MKYLYFYDTKIGKIGIAEEDGYIIKIYFENGKIIKEDYEIFESEVIKEASSQLNQYLNGKRKEFNLSEQSLEKMFGIALKIYLMVIQVHTRKLQLVLIIRKHVELLEWQIIRILYLLLFHVTV